MDRFEPYEPRPIRPLEPYDDDAGWRLKVYGISHGRETPRDVLVRAARRVAAGVLPTPAAGAGRYGVGFLGIHDGRGACFVFVDWWADENELHHHVFVSPADDPTALVETTATGLIACVWDLAVIGHERQAWIDTVMANPDGPDLEAYLSRLLEQTV